MLRTIATHSNKSHTNAKRYACALKNIMDQKKLKNNCTQNDIIASVLFSLVLVVTTRYNAIPISTYRIVHTTGKSHAGGDNGGLLISSKSFILPDAKRAEIPPIAKGIAIQTSSFFHSILKSITSQYFMLSFNSIYTKSRVSPAL